MTGVRAGGDLLGACALAATLAVGGVVAGAAPARAADLDGTLDAVQVRGGSLDFLLTAPAGGTGAPIDPASVQVSVGGQSATTTAATAAGELVQRRLVLLIDVSGSMKGAGIAAAQQAARTLVGAVAPDVEVGLVTFDDDARVVLAPTRDRAGLVTAVDRLTAQDETALYDGVALAMTTLGGSGDRTMVLLSDGGDTVSVSTLQTTEQQLAASGVRAQVVGFRTDESQDAVLQALATAGNGAVVTAQDGAGLTRAFQDVATTLSSQVQVTAALPEGVDGAQVIRVAALAGADRVRATASVVLPRVRPAPDDEPVPVAQVASSVLGARVPVWFATPWPGVALFALLGGLIGAVAAGLRRSPRPATRLEQVEFYGLSGRKVDPAPTPRDARQLGQPVLDAAESLVRRRGREANLALLLDRADLPVRPHEYLVLRVAGALAALALAVLTTDAWVVVLLAPVLGWACVAGFVRWRARQRVALFAAQLPDALALVASSLQTGFSLSQALDSIARDTAEPLRGQFTRAMAENKLGADLEDALERVADRMACEDLGWTVMAIRIQRQVGGNLAETLRTTTATLRERASLRRQVKALSADGRFSAYVLLALPPLLTVGLVLVSPDYVSRLWSQPLGLLMLAVAAVGMVVGSVWIRSLVKVDL